MGKMLIREIFEAVSNENSTNLKERILKDNDSELLRTILNDTYGPTKYNMKKFEIRTDDPAILTIDSDYSTFRELLGRLATREITGNEARGEVGTVLGWFIPEDRIWLQRILEKNLKIGAGNTFAEDAGVIKKFPVALANSLKDAKNVDPLDGTWLISRKLDGCRCLMFIRSDENGVEVIPRSRQNKEFTTLDVLKESYKKLFKGIHGDWVVDGEVCVVDEDGNESFKGIMNQITRKDYTIPNPVHLVFDCLTAEEFWGNKPSRKLTDRLDMFNAMEYQGILPDNIVLLPQQRVTDQTVLNTWMETAKKHGWEGCMIRKDVPYEGKRSNSLLKIKPMQDAEYVVKDVIKGELTFAIQGEGNVSVYCVSALVIEHKGNEVKVGSGLTRDQRIRWNMYPEEIIGKTITVQYFEETQDSKTKQYSLRFPTLKYVYKDGREI